jgi:phosphatidylglycerophosphatase A
MGAVVALPTAWLMSTAPWWAWTFVLGVACVGSVWAVNRYIAVCSRGDDPQEVVLDEWLGCLIALAFVPWHPGWVLAAFALFRLFDIWKPGPIRRVHDRLHGGAGVMGDDVLAGLLAGVLLAGVHVFV